MLEVDASFSTTAFPPRIESCKVSSYGIRKWSAGEIFLPDFKIDALNRGIVDALQADPSTTNKEIGDRLGVSEVTVAARIRAMEEGNILRVMMQRDVRSLGFHVISLIDINVEGRRPEDVAEELAEIDQCIAVVLSLSSPDIILHVMTPDNACLQQFVDEKIAPIAGITSYEIITTLDVIKMDNRYGAVGAA